VCGDLELGGIGFASTRLGEHDGVVVLKREAVEEDEGGVVPVDAVENALV
jgi:hypothetical protein